MNAQELPRDTKTPAPRLAGRTAVVTGATSGIGAATARRLAAEGAAVAVLGRRGDRLQELVGELGDDGTVALAVDVTDPSALAAASDTIRRELGTVDVVVANAGAMLAAPFERADLQEWDRMIDVNVRGLLLTGRAFAADLLAAAERGRPADLVHVGSVGGHLTFPTYGVYCATKAAVAHLTRNLRGELGPRGVRVKCIEPGLTATELGDDMQDADGREVLEQLRATVASLQPADIADAIAYAVAAPAEVNVAELIVVPTAQG